MKIKNLLTFKNIKAIVTVIFFVAVCMFAQNFYKCTVSYIANNYVDGMFMPTMIGAYVIPVICFLCYFCNYYVKRFNKVATLIYSPIITIASVFILVNIFANISVYVSNNALGGYGCLPSIIIGFPYDMILVHVGLIVVQVINVLSVIKPECKISQFKEHLYTLDYFKINIFEYLLLAIISILTCLFTGLFVCGLSALGNIVDDVKYIYLLLWYLVPVFNLICLVFKFERKFTDKKVKVLYLLSLIVVNVVFASLYFIFEKLDPNFIVQIGKPLLPITFSISKRIELLIHLITQGIGCFLFLVKVPLVLLKKDK